MHFFYLVALALSPFIFAGCANKDYEYVEPYYCEDEGYDFATGEDVLEKRYYKTGKTELIRSEGYSKLYEKYNLSHPEPLLSFYGGTSSQMACRPYRAPNVRTRLRRALPCARAYYSNYKQH